MANDIQLEFTYDGKDGVFCTTSDTDIDTLARNIFDAVAGSGFYTKHEAVGPDGGDYLVINVLKTRKRILLSLNPLETETQDND